MIVFLSVSDSWKPGDESVYITVSLCIVLASNASLFERDGLTGLTKAAFLLVVYTKAMIYNNLTIALPSTTGFLGLLISSISSSASSCHFFSFFYLYA